MVLGVIGVITQLTKNKCEIVVERTKGHMAKSSGSEEVLILRSVSSTSCKTFQTTVSYESFKIFAYKDKPLLYY